MELLRKHHRILKILIALSSLALIAAAFLTPFLASGSFGQ